MILIRHALHCQTDTHTRDTDAGDQWGYFHSGGPESDDESKRDHEQPDNSGDEHSNGRLHRFLREPMLDKIPDPPCGEKATRSIDEQVKKTHGTNTQK